MNLLGIDFEEWFHPQLIQEVLKYETKSFEIVKGIDKIIEFLGKHETYATFFMVGELLEHKPDILCLQEIKAMKEQVDLQLPFYPYHYWNSAEKKGYSGTAIFSKIKPLNYFYGLGIKKHDHEGRVITLEFKDYYIIQPSTIGENKRKDYSINIKKEKAKKVANNFEYNSLTNKNKLSVSEIKKLLKNS